jgi:hyperosmotically inducible periplasmic protein
MKMLRPVLGVFALSILLASESSSMANKTADVTASVSEALKQAGLKDVSVNQDKKNGVVTLRGNVQSEGDKMQAETIAKSLSPGMIVGNEAAVLPPGLERTAKEIHSDFDTGIGSNLHAALVQNGFQDDVHYDVRNGVVTLTGDVNSQKERNGAEQRVAHVPYVRQVINKLDVRNQKATSSR